MSTVPDHPPTHVLVLAGQRARQTGAVGLTNTPRLPGNTGEYEETRRPGPISQPISSAEPLGLPRSVRPEILDSLRPDDPAARRSRRDLRIINRLLGSRAWLKQSLGESRVPGESVLELGAGTGDFGGTLRAVALRFAGLDIGRRPCGWPRHARWFETDVMGFDRWADYPVVVANLFFHHFDSVGLARIGACLQAHTRVVIASEPLRVRRTLALFMLACPLIRAHPVTRHDGRVSINAGFRGDELPRLLRLDPDAWRWQVDETWRGSCHLVAVRRRR